MFNILPSYAYAVNTSERKSAGVVLLRAYKVENWGHGTLNGRC